MRQQSVRYAAKFGQQGIIEAEAESAVSYQCTTTPRYLMVRGIDDKHTFDKYQWPETAELLLSQAEVTAMRAQAIRTMWLGKAVKATYIDGTPIPDDRDQYAAVSDEMHNTMQAEDYPPPPEDF